MGDGLAASGVGDATELGLGTGGVTDIGAIATPGPGP